MSIANTGMLHRYILKNLHLTARANVAFACIDVASGSRKVMKSCFLGPQDPADHINSQKVDCCQEQMLSHIKLQQR